MIRYARRSLTPGRQPSRAPCHSHAARDRMRQRVLGAAGGLLVTVLAACSVLTCQPVPVTVVQKEERSRLDMVSRGLGTSATGRVEELRVPEVVREHWVRAQDGTWHRVSADQFRAVEVGGSVELCR